MIRIKELWNSVFFRFISAFIIVGLIPLFTLSIFSLQTFTNHVQQYTVSNLSQMIVYMGYNLDNAFNQYDEIAKLMYYSHNTSPTTELVNQTEAVNEFERINHIPIHDFLKTVLRSDPYISSAYFVRSSDHKLYYESLVGTAFYFERLPVEEWLDILEEDETSLALTLPHEIDYFYNADRLVMTFGRNLIDITEPISPERKVVGTLFFDVDLDMFEGLLSELRLNDADELYVLDQHENIIYSNKKELIGTKLSRDHADHTGKIVFNQPLSSINGSIEFRFSSTGLFEQLTSMQSAVYLVIIICILIIIVMGIWFSRTLSSPIKAVIRQMMIMESGNLDVQIQKVGNDEIGRLARGFNRMVERLKVFIKEAYVAELGRKQAELNALKSQIRPHYLYNTLEVIRMNAVHNDDAEVADMILSLSNQLKYVIGYGEEQVSINKELEHLQNYFYIIKVSYENMIDLKIDASPEVDPNWLILKLTLQPIVENAIQHGIRPKGGKGTVKVSLEANETQLKITVIDDGVGMEEKRLQQVRACMDDGESTRHGKAKNTGVGLKNVHERIRNEFGPEYGLTINSKSGLGTYVTLYMPIKKGEDADGDKSRTG